MLTRDTIDRVKQQDIPTLVALDKRGLIVAPNESAEAFAKRLETLRLKLDDVRSQVQTEPFYEIEGMKFKSENAIPKEDFKAATVHTKSLFGFKMKWVPGFYQNPKPSILFGGCCYTSEPDLYSFFQIRESFKKQQKWLFYNRDELMAHEMCHVARGGIGAKKYEEFFAYKTSEKQLRKAMGSVLYSQMDTYLILLMSLSLPLFQFYNLKYRFDNPISIWPLLSGFGALILFYILRYFGQKSSYEAALNYLNPTFGADSQAVLFRCNDQEIDEFAMLDANTDQADLEPLKEKDLRWQVIFNRFVKSEVVEPVETKESE